ncbi:MAG: hypothetical protein HUU01_16465 [Saprospiraceae bacterium]|nr:hypothetical protein [Saprospiraceae bacterium]
MDEKDFDKLFSEKMKTAGAPDFSDADWQPLSQRLDSWQRRRWGLLPLWWLGALSGLLLFSNAFWWFTWRESNDHLASLLQQTLETREQASISSSDTLYRTVVVHHYDTIYRTLVLRPELAAGLSATGDGLATESQQTQPELIAGSEFPEKAAGTGKMSTPPNASNLQASALADKTTALSDQHSGINNAQNAVAGGIEGAREAISAEEIARMQEPVAEVSPLPLKHFGEIKRHRRVPIPLPPLADWETAKPKEKKPFPLTPKSLRLGAGGGWALPGAAVIASKSGTAIGLKGEIGFSDQLSLTLEGTFNKLKFQGYVYDGSIGLPAPNPPGDNYNFKYFETHNAPKPMFQLTAAMRYQFSTAQKLSPFFGVGFATQWHPEYELEYEYTYQPNGSEFSENVEVEDLEKPLSFLHFEFGLSYKIAKSWGLQASGFYDTEASRSQIGIPRLYGLKTFLLYEF